MFNIILYFIFGGIIAKCVHGMWVSWIDHHIKLGEPIKLYWWSQPRTIATFVFFTWFVVGIPGGLYLIWALSKSSEG